MKKNKILVVGDVHGNFGKFNALINVKRPELIICTGEFGYWPNPDCDLKKIKTHGAKLLWIDGNHEDFWALSQRETDELAPNIVYMPRGSTYTLPDGRKILFMGGANSIDKNLRTKGVDWFPEETISHRDFQAATIPEIGQIDIFITHTCPRELVALIEPWKGEAGDPSTLALSQLWQIYKPEIWIFSHWHFYKTGILGGSYQTRWYCLSLIQGVQKWWMWLPPKKNIQSP